MAVLLLFFLLICIQKVILFKIFKINIIDSALKFGTVLIAVKPKGKIATSLSPHF